jgi:DNA-binding response OmpR family regulator
VSSLLRRSKTDKAKAAKVKGAANGDGSRLGVLVVNDNEDSCELLCRVIQHTGIVAFRAHSSEGAVDELSAHIASVQAVVLDFSSGTAASFSVLEAIREDPDLGHLCVMVIATTDANRRHAFDLGADEFLTRPFHVDEFTAAVSAMLARSPDEREAHRQAELNPDDWVADDDGAEAPEG